MQNVLKRKNMYLEGFQIILNLFPDMFQTILNLLICISRKKHKEHLICCRSAKNSFCPTWPVGFFFLGGGHPTLEFFFRIRSLRAWSLLVSAFCLFLINFSFPLLFFLVVRLKRISF